MKQRDILIVVGSLRADSINRRLADALKKCLPPHFAAHDAALDLPLFNQDDEHSPTPAVSAFKQQVARADGLIFVTPEHNRSVPAALKNALDWGSRPPGESVWSGKPAGVLGTSTGGPGTALAQQHLRNILVCLGVDTLSTPEVFLQMKEGLIDAQSNITDPRTEAFLQKWVDRYVAWVERLAA
ncbi:NADPH-dependent FMN reductase [Bordetella trematum]|uniref:NADPH-dependent FMN reductase n=1 Tax=Bordetella trematum TaxID=123899 RepID=UPI000C778A20|nr:NADPH-dependent FMN reductase [Bordetella trematum]AUL48006.1 NADPH-dependent FMN reductase [Bordetella trematum]